MSRKITRRTFLKALLNTSIVMGTGAGTLYYGSQVEAFDYQIVQRELTLPRLHPAFDGYTITQISDIHVDLLTTNRERLQQAIEMVNAQKTDLTLITGDLLTGYSDEVAQIIVDEFPKFISTEPIINVWGNHDWWSGPGLVEPMMREAGLYTLVNDVYTIERDGQYLHISGVDDWWEKHSDIDAVLAKLPTEGCAIMLAHEPDYADITAATGRFDLQLSGHSHGGQVRVPALGAPILPDLGKKYSIGLYQVGDMQQYTNRGLGMVYPPVRINCRPEITVLTLRVKNK